MTSLYEFEYSIPVEAYCNEDVSAREAFDEASEDTPKVLAQVAEWVGEDIDVVKAEFVEFDAANVSHANAIFNVTLQGPAAKIEEFLKVEALYDDEMIADARQ